jgi:hypothetical protein
MSNTNRIEKKQAFETYGFFTPVCFLSSGRIHVSAMRFPTLAEAIAYLPTKDLRVSASAREFAKYYGHKTLLD